MVGGPRRESSPRIRCLFEQPTNPLHRVALRRPGGGRIPGGFEYVELSSGVESAGMEVTATAGSGIGRLDLVGVARKVTPRRHDRLATLASSARMPLSRSLGDGLFERTTQSVISRLEEGGGARNRLDTLARVATALERHLVVSFPEKVPSRLKDAVPVA